MRATRNGVSPTTNCDCRETQTMSHIVNSCPLTKFDGGLLRLHEADEAAVDLADNIWLLAHDNNNTARTAATTTIATKLDTDERLDKSHQ